MSCYFSQGSLFGIVCVLLVISCVSNGCFEEERTALLDIYGSLLGTSAEMPSSWLQSDNCCSWERVICNNSTKCISHLYLSRLSFLSDEFSSENGCQTNLNSTAFSAFRELRFLDFSMNHVTFQIWEGLVGLTKLQHLNLSSNNCLNGTIPASLGKLVSLEVLHLEFTGMVGTLPTSVFENLRNLRELYLSSNQFNGTLPASLGKLVSLEVLHLEFNGMVGTLPTSGAIPNCSSTTMTLQFLDVSGNSLSGDILPNSFFKSFSVQALDLSHNEFTGNIEWIQYLGRIRYLSLGSNKFEGQISPNICQLQSLRIIDLSNNSLSGSLPPCIGFNYASCYEQRGFRFATKRKLYTYRRNFINWFSGMDLSANMLSGEIPWELGNLNHIQALNLSYNIFTGPIPATFANMIEIESLDLSRNKLSGPIPWQLTRLTSLAVFSVAHNNLSGCIPNSGQFGSFGMDSYQGNNNLYMASQGSGCASNPGSGPSPLEDSDEEAADPVLYAVSAASFVVTFWATVAFMFCHSFGRRVILKL